MAVQNPSLLITVTPAESGIKLLSFLEKRLEGSVPSGQLHRWVRTGQVRVNKKRAKPFMRLADGDAVRVPPFAQVQDCAPLPAIAAWPQILWQSPTGAALRVVGSSGGILALHKPAGLAVQPGSGLHESVSQILADLHDGCPFTPAPAHRLDRHTSGLLLVGLTHAAQMELCGWFARKDALIKEYLAWVAGRWPGDAGWLDLCDHIRKEAGADGRERMVVVPGSKALAGDEPARCAVRSPGAIHWPHKTDNGATTGAEAGTTAMASLLSVRLITGRTHQIRVQLASRGFPLIGDRRYNGPPYPRLLLHAHRITLPDGSVFVSPPDWPPPFRLLPGQDI